MTVVYLRKYDLLIVANRPAVFREWKWKGRIYADIEYTDVEPRERGTAHVMDIQPLAEACVAAVRDCFIKLDARLAAIDAWDPLDSDEPRP